MFARCKTIWITTQIPRRIADGRSSRCRRARTKSQSEPPLRRLESYATTLEKPPTKKKIGMTWNTHVASLNPAQRQAVTHYGGPLLIVAGAGSGKTRVLTNRIAHLIRARNVNPFSILAITFTNKAAGEMKERVGQLVGERLGGAMWVMTFHSACVRILRREGVRLGYKSTFTIYDDSDSERLIGYCLRDLEIDAKRFSS